MLLLNVTGGGGGGGGGAVPLAVDFDSPEDYFVFIFQILFATSTVLLAGTVAISIATTRALRLQNRFIFMLNTSVCDTLVGFSVYYLGLFDVQEGYPSRNGTYNVLPSLLGVNILTFLFAQFDRYFAVCHPFIYSRFITRHFIISVNIYCWVYNFAHLLARNVLPLSKAMQLYVFSIVLFQLVVLTKVVMTIKLYVVARFQLERDPPSADRDAKKESLKIIIFVVISFLVLWCPSFVNIIARFVGGNGLTFRNEATNIFAIMARLNALCTPSVYVWGSPALREAMLKRVWGRACPRCRSRVASWQGKTGVKKSWK